MAIDNYLYPSILHMDLALSEQYYDNSGWIIAIISSLETTKLIPTVKSKYFHFEAGFCLKPQIHLEGKNSNYFINHATLIATIYNFLHTFTSMILTAIFN